MAFVFEIAKDSATNHTEMADDADSLKVSHVAILYHFILIVYN